MEPPYFPKPLTAEVPLGVSTQWKNRTNHNPSLSCVHREGGRERTSGSGEHWGVAGTGPGDKKKGEGSMMGTWKPLEVGGAAQT